ncbi:MAG: hypothetical protein MZV70_42555 [Desulfobacterales bacterium]|nr:hypothetical protein [Desulfobacterales bacterium]
MVRIDARTADGAIDWNANGASRRTSCVRSGHQLQRPPRRRSLNGSDDWSSILLNQIGARRNTGGVFASTPRGLPPRGAVVAGFRSRRPGTRGPRAASATWGAATWAAGTWAAATWAAATWAAGTWAAATSWPRGDLGRGDLGRGDLGGGDLFVGDPDSPGGELDFETATRPGEDAAERVHGVRDRRHVRGSPATRVWPAGRHPTSRGDQRVRRLSRAGQRARCPGRHGSRWRGHHGDSRAGDDTPGRRLGRLREGLHLLRGGDVCRRDPERPVRISCRSPRPRPRRR